MRKIKMRYACVVKTVLAVVVLLCGLTVGQQPQAVLTPYVIVAHKDYDYTVRHGRDLMKVTYAESQTSSAKPGDFPGSELHLHTRRGEHPHGPDLSQVPEVGVSIRQCQLSAPDKDGDPVIAVQPTSEPCMVQN
jgi:hypothetical protein